MSLPDQLVPKPTCFPLVQAARFIPLDQTCLPTAYCCQDTGTAIVMGKSGQYVWTDGQDEEALSRGIRADGLASETYS